MTNDSNSSMHDFHERKATRTHGGSGIVGAAYFMAFIGAAVYYIQQATSFGIGVIGFLKALVWPAFLVYNLLQFIKM